MFGIRYLKAPPTQYVLHYKGGRVVSEGAGLSFLYYAPTSTVVLVPVGSADLPFAFNEVTADFQAVTLQGQVTYSVSDPRKLASLLDYSVDASGTYRSDDPELLKQRLIHQIQVLTRALVERLGLREALTATDRLVTEVLPALRKTELPVQILDLSILSVRPTPDMAKALEAEAREALQRRSDQAIYDRRNAAVEQERRIKESELNTELAVEEKKRQIRETQIAADIAVEERRAVLVEQSASNEKKVADSRAYGLEASLKPLRGMDWKVLMAASSGAHDPRATIALAFRELADNAQKIGQLNITPDLLGSLLEPPNGK